MLSRSHVCCPPAGTFVQRLGMPSDSAPELGFFSKETSRQYASRPSQDDYAEINKKGHIVGKHGSRSDVDPSNTRRWFFILSQSVRQSPLTWTVIWNISMLKLTAGTNAFVVMITNGVCRSQICLSNMAPSERCLERWRCEPQGCC